MFFSFVGIIIYRRRIRSDENVVVLKESVSSSMASSQKLKAKFDRGKLFLGQSLWV